MVRLAGLADIVQSESSSGSARGTLSPSWARYQLAGAGSDDRGAWVRGVGSLRNRRNWGGMITVQQDHKLIQRGPYAIVRHPIYSGFMLATLGTAIILGEIGGLVSVALIVISWGYKAHLEESFMIEQFGVEYEKYSTR